MGGLIIFESVFENIIADTSKFHFLFGERDSFKLEEDGSKNLYDILSHVLTISEGELQKFLGFLQKSTDLIIPCLPISNDAIFYKIVTSIHRNRPFLSIFSKAGACNVVLQNSDKSKKKYKTAMSLCEIRPVAFDGKKVGLEIVSKPEYKGFHIIDENVYYDEYFTVPAQAKNYYAQLRKKINDEHADYFRGTN